MTANCGKNIFFIFVIFLNLTSMINGQEDTDYDLNDQDGGNRFDTDYCDEKLCGQRTHIVCERNGKGWDEICGDEASYYLFSIETESDVEDTINKVRNNLAKGNTTKNRKKEEFPKAARMATITWDYELAFFAELAVQKCIFENYKNYSCGNTEEYPHAGFASGQFRRFRNQKVFLKDTIGSVLTVIRHDWFFNEVSEFPMELIKSFDYSSYLASNEDPPFELATLIMDINDKVGCATAILPNGDFLNSIVVCYFASRPVQSRPLYIAGEPGSGCKTGTNPKYDGLCSEDESYERY